MIDSIVSAVLNQLSTILSQEGNILGGLKQAVKHIRDELGQMTAFLQVAEAKEEDDPGLKEWAKQLREVAYEIEEILDEFVFLFPHHHADGFSARLRRICNRIKNLKARHNIASEIQNLQNRIRKISESRQRYQTEIGPSHRVVGSDPVINAWLYDTFLEGKAKLEGIKRPRQQLLSQLLEGDSRLKVISVVGVQGIGKTTLVKKVHEDTDVRNEFQIRAWVPASPTRNTMDLLKDLIRQICEQIKKPVAKIVESITAVDAGLKSLIRDLLQGKRYVIVFDDVCDMDFWNSVKSALPDGTYGSRVMLTTHIPDVAQASTLESQGYVHKMNPLSFEESWNLFRHRTFKDNHCPRHLKDIAQEIVRKCDGLPLAIATMAGLLALKDTNKIEDWESVRHSIGGEEDVIGTLDVVKKALHLSYKNLPSHLKTCLLYVSIFPQGYEIQCHRLIQLWIAEKFVQRREGKTYEEVALDYLKELIGRDLIQVVELSWDGSPDQCRVHDLVREMILCKSQEQNMMTIVSGQQRGEPNKVYRLVINNSFNSTHESSNFDHLRSIITFGSMESLKEELRKLLSSKPLKVLDFKDAKLEEVPEGVFNLCHLKYLCLRGTRVTSIPTSIKKLQNLELLHLGETNVRELPEEILKLRKLRHLRVFQVGDSSDFNYQCRGFKPPSKIGSLISLYTLLFVDAQNDKKTIVGELGKLIYLRELGITMLRRQDGKELCSSLEKLHNLQELDVAATEKIEVIDLNYSLSSSALQSLRGLILRGRLERFPPWMKQLDSLKKIELIWSRLSAGDDPLVSLQHLPNLVQVYFTQAYEGEGLHFKAGGFLKLEMLNLKNMDGLKRVMIEDGSTPQLRRLYLSELPLLEELPFGIKHLKVQSLHLSDVNSALTSRLVNQDDASEEHRKIEHVPEVLVGFWLNGEWKERRL